MSRILIIADATESAQSVWAKTTETITWLLDQLANHTVMGIALLGTKILWQRRDWQTNMRVPMRGQHSFSVLAPVFQNLSRRKYPFPNLTIVVGAGQIFDLAEWRDQSYEWLLVRTSEASLQEEGLDFPEVEADKNEIALLLDDLLQEEGNEIRTSFPSLQGFVHHEWTLDASGFPMIYVPPINGYLSLFPLSKVQLETLLASKRDRRYNDSWYQELLNVLPRTTFSKLGYQSYERLFVTGILPTEVLDITPWLGGEVTVPDSNAWRTAYRWMSKQSVSILPSELNQRLHPSARRLWLALVKHLQPQTILQLSLMKNGIIEWIDDGSSTWAGLGKTRPEFYPSFYDPLRDNPMLPVSQNRRNKLFGVRFLRRLS